MKRFKLSKDTALYPKGTEAYWEEREQAYVVYILYENGWEKDVHKLRKRQIEDNSVWEEIPEDQREEEETHCDKTSRSEEVDHQALREESLKELHWLEMYKEPFILNVNTNKSEPMLHVGFEVQMKYADAWRELLDKE